MHSKQLESEVYFKTTRSGGKGGQHVNKVSTKVELYFDIKQAESLTSEQKDTLFKKLANKISNEGVLKLTCDTTRSQVKNKEIAWKKFKALLEASLRKKAVRKATKIPKSSKEKRLEGKKRHSERKNLRRRPEW